MFGSSNPFLSLQSKSESQNPPSSVIGKKEDGELDEGKESFKQPSVTNPFASVGDQPQSGFSGGNAFGKTSSGGGFTFESFLKPSLDNSEKPSFTFKPSISFGEKDRKTKNRSSFIEEPNSFGRSELGTSQQPNIESKDSGTISVVSSSFGEKNMFVPLNVQEKNPFVPRTGKISSTLILKGLDSTFTSSKEAARNYVNGVLQPSGILKVIPIISKQAIKIHFRNDNSAVQAKKKIKPKLGVGATVKFGKEKELTRSEPSNEDISTSLFDTSPDVANPFDTFGSSQHKTHERVLREEKKRHSEPLAMESTQPSKITRRITGISGGISPFDRQTRHSSRLPEDDGFQEEVYENPPPPIRKRETEQPFVPVTSHLIQKPRKSSPEPSGFSAFLKSTSKANAKKRSTVATDAIDIDLATKRFQILEARDKKVREMINDLRDDHGAQVGTCQDLCPEKERYRRWTQQDISVLEMKQGQMCKEMCLKVYQRSAADTEESLPNELRPSGTLKDCCWYLCSEICTDEKIYQHGSDVWYDFMWKRTRAIRKDITQQHMSCTTTAFVLEAVARYHIWCAHSLVAEGFWSPRINDENLEKTLTSIEHVYQDIAVRNQFSPAEPEFRAYMIYMSLNNTNAVMKHLSRVPARFKNSEIIKRARRIISAFMLRNYVKFWHEISKCTALEASVLHRYFNEVRVMAMQAIRRGYSNNKLPLELFRKALFFAPDDERFDYYLAAHNVFTNEEGFIVVNEMSKVYQSIPDEPLPKWNSKIISGELSGGKTPGTLIWGSHSGPLRPWEEKKYQPASSFAGKTTTLLETAQDVVDLVREKLEEKLAENAETPETSAVHEVVDDITNDVVCDQIQEIAVGVRIQEKMFRKQTEANLEIILNEAIKSEIKRIYMNMLLEEKLKRQEEENEKEQEAASYIGQLRSWRKDVAQNCSAKIIKSVVATTAKSELMESINLKVKLRNNEIVNSQASSITESVIETTFTEIICEELKYAIHQARNEEKSRIMALRQRRRDRVTKQAAFWWLRRTRGAIRSRKAREVIPTLAKRDYLKQIGRRNDEFTELTLKTLRRDWKSNRRSVDVITPFDIIGLMTDLTTTGYISSVLIYTTESKFDSFLAKTFPITGVIKTMKNAIYLDTLNCEPSDEIAYDHELMLGTNDDADICIELPLSEMNILRIKRALISILDNVETKPYMRSPFIKIVERALVDSDHGLMYMDGLVGGYQTCRARQNPSLIVNWFNNLVSQLTNRLIMDGVDIVYPKDLLISGMLFGSTISYHHINVLKNLKLKPFNISSTDCPDECLQTLFTYLGSMNLDIPTLKVQITRIMNRKLNDDQFEENVRIPWTDIFTKIIETKLMRLHFTKYGRQLVTVHQRTFRRFDVLDDVRMEIRRMSITSLFRKPKKLVGVISPPVNEIRPVLPEESKDPMESSPSTPGKLTIENLFIEVESKFTDEISKSKQTLVDAKGTIATLKKDFERFQEMESLRTMVQSKHRKRDFTFMEAEKYLLEKELDTKFTEIDLLVAYSKKRRHDLMDQLYCIDPIEVEYGFGDAVIYDSDTEPINFERSDMSDILSRGRECLNMHNDRKMSTISMMHPAPPSTNDHRDSICSTRPPRVDETVGMVVSDDESSSAPGRIYDNPLTSGPRKRLDDEETRMALSESSDSEVEEQAPVLAPDSQNAYFIASDDEERDQVDQGDILLFNSDVQDHVDENVNEDPVDDDHVDEDHVDEDHVGEDHVDEDIVDEEYQNQEEDYQEDDKHWNEESQEEDEPMSQDDIVILDSSTDQPESDNARLLSSPFAQFVAPPPGQQDDQEEFIFYGEDGQAPIGLGGEEDYQYDNDYSNCTPDWEEEDQVPENHGVVYRYAGEDNSEEDEDDYSLDRVAPIPRVFDDEEDEESEESDDEIEDYFSERPPIPVSTRRPPSDDEVICLDSD